MSKKLTKKQLKKAKGGSGTTTLTHGEARLEDYIVPAIDAPIPPDPHVVIVVKGATKSKASKKPGDDILIRR